MQWTDFSVGAGPALVGAVVLGLFASSAMLLRRRWVAPARLRSRRRVLPLLEAASLICELAGGEHLAISVIARRSDQDLSVHEWFARSLAAVVPTYRKIDERTFERLGQPLLADFEYRFIYIRKADIRAYMRWARTLL